MNLPKRAPENTVQRTDQETQDEIEQIMSEIEQLQKEIGQTEAAAPAPQPASGAKAALASASRPKPTLVKTAPAEDGPTIQSAVTETDPLEEFRATAGTGAGEPGLEDTLSDLPGEQSNGGALGSDHDSESEVNLSEESHQDEFDELEEEAAVADADKRTALAQAARQVKEAFDEMDDEPVVAHFEDEDEDEDEKEESGAMRDVSEVNSKGSDGSLTMNLKGNMTLKLQYECEGQSVTIGFSDHALRVQLADGTEFKIPMGNRPHARKSA